jgi:AcrR family transcriptional regulator
VAGPSEPKTRRTAGVRTRGRAADVVERVLAATGQELSRVGYGAMRVDDVATRSGVNKTTIYRRWPTKSELVVAAMREIMSLPTELDTGSVRGDLRASLLEVLTFAESPMNRGLVRTMQIERADPEVEAITRALRQEHRARRIEMVKRGIARGELPESTDADLVVDLVSAPVMSRALNFGETVTPSYVDAVLDVVLAGFRSLRPA